MHAILVLLGSSAPFEDFILSTLYNPLDIDRISINSSLFIRYRCRLFYPVDIYLYIDTSFPIDDIRADFFAVFFWR